MGHNSMSSSSCCISVSQSWLELLSGNTYISNPFWSNAKIFFLLFGCFFVVYVLCIDLGVNEAAIRKFSNVEKEPLRIFCLSFFFLVMFLSSPVGNNLLEGPIHGLVVGVAGLQEQALSVLPHGEAPKSH